MRRHWGLRSNPSDPTTKHNSAKFGKKPDLTFLGLFECCLRLVRIHCLAGIHNTDDVPQKGQATERAAGCKRQYRGKERRNKHDIDQS